MHNAYLKTVFDSFIDKSLLKCLVFNDNVNNISSYDVIFYVTRFVAASFILPVFCLTGPNGLKGKRNYRNEYTRM